MRVKNNFIKAVNNHCGNFLTNTKSSMEAELVAIDDAMGQILRTCHFLAAQGIAVPTLTIYQDNKSLIPPQAAGTQNTLTYGTSS